MWTERYKKKTLQCAGLLCVRTFVNLNWPKIGQNTIRCSVTHTVIYCRETCFLSMYWTVTTDTVFSHMTSAKSRREKQWSVKAVYTETSLVTQQVSHISLFQAMNIWVTCQQNKNICTQLVFFGTCNPYTAAAIIFQSLKTIRSLPELQFSDVYIYLVENLSVIQSLGEGGIEHKCLLLSGFPL